MDGIRVDRRFLDRVDALERPGRQTADPLPEELVDLPCLARRGEPRRGS
jgi:hypothetical protein